MCRQYDRLLQECLRTCELYQLRKITIIGQLQSLKIHFTLLRTINRTAIPPTEFIQSKHMQSNQICHDSGMPAISIGKAMNRYQTVLKSDCNFFRYISLLLNPKICVIDVGLLKFIQLPLR